MFWLVLYLQEAEAALDFNLTKIAHYTTPKLSYPRIYQDYLFCKATEHSNLLFWAELKNPELLNTLNLTYQYQPYSWEILSTFTDAYLFLGASNGVNIYRYSFDLHYRLNIHDLRRGNNPQWISIAKGSTNVAYLTFHNNFLYGLGKKADIWELCRWDIHDLEIPILMNSIQLPFGINPESPMAIAVAPHGIYIGNAGYSSSLWGLIRINSTQFTLENIYTQRSCSNLLVDDRPPYYLFTGAHFQSGILDAQAKKFVYPIPKTGTYYGALRKNTFNQTPYITFVNEGNQLALYNISKIGVLQNEEKLKIPGTSFIMDFLFESNYLIVSDKFASTIVFKVSSPNISVQQTDKDTSTLIALIFLVIIIGGCIIIWCLRRSNHLYQIVT